jgi:hypothetical protein
MTCGSLMRSFEALVVHTMWTNVLVINTLCTVKQHSDTDAVSMAAWLGDVSRVSARLLSVVSERAGKSARED